MRHRDDDVARAAQRFEELADALDPDSAEVDRMDDLRRVATAAEAVRAEQAHLRHAVDAARVNGRSWNQIATALGVTRQAARQRFGEKSHA